ncbi:MAG: DNA helicase RecQ [Methylocystaceae bacterium]
MDKHQILKYYFGYDQYKFGQEAIIDQILAHRDVLAIMPTGGGKSLGYQVPALLNPGTALVISPLISLMKDQVDALHDRGIAAAFINSSLSASELHMIFQQARNGVYKLLYIAPERLESDSFATLASVLDISFIAVDEAHCVSQWGHDFRPSYLRIAKLINQLPVRPTVAAFTATATDLVKRDIISQLGLQNPYQLNAGIDRENLYFEVAKPTDKFAYLHEFLNANGDSSGIIYCATRKTVETVSAKLQQKGIAATRYHAGLSESERTANQAAFSHDQKPIMVATNAFGLGIDKSNLRFVLHYNLPRSIESYYQEAGRAGRDGEIAQCLLLYSAADIITNKLLIENSGQDVDKTEEYQKLSAMSDYCHTDGCLRQYILKYFGDSHLDGECGNCGNCNSQIESTDITIEAQKIMSCIKRMGERFGSSMVVNVLRGSQAAKLNELGFNQLSTYGIMKDYAAETIKEIIAFLVAEGYLSVTGDKYPILVLNSRSYMVVRGQEAVSIRRVIKKQSVVEAGHALAVDSNLLVSLKQLRKELAIEQGVAPFVVFSDASLHAMCRQYPLTEQEFLNIPGVGDFKLQKYGRQFITAIKQYVQDHNLEPSRDLTTSNKVKRRRDEPSPPRVDTRMVTYELYNSGKTVPEIMAERGLTEQTIMGHLIESLQRGLPLDYECFIPHELEPAIIEAIKIHGTTQLKLIKAALPPEVTYGAIKLVIYKYQLG